MRMLCRSRQEVERSGNEVRKSEMCQEHTGDVPEKGEYPKGELEHELAG